MHPHGARVRVGFSLIELMLVIAIIGALITVAVPQLTELHLRAKRSELALNVNGIKVDVVAFDAERGGYLDAGPYPETPHKLGVPWVPSESGNFQSLSWRPDGLVRGSYIVEAGDTDFTVRGMSDVDGDGNYADWEATADREPHAVSPNDVY